MKLPVLVLSMLLLGATGSTAQSRGTVLSGPYLGQEPPGTTPRLFAPGIVSVDADFEHSAAVFSPDGKEVFWCARRNLRSDQPGDPTQRLLFMREREGRWSDPQVAPFTAHLNIPMNRPVFSPDGNRLYLEYFSDTTRESDTDIYVVERVGDGWSQPKSVSPLINTRAIERLHWVTSDGSLYFTRNPMTPHEEIFVARWVDGAFTAPERLGEAYNSDAEEFALVISAAGDYMLTCQSRDRRVDELRVSFREADGSWTDRFRAPFGCGGFLALSPDDKYLFFLGDGIYWVSTAFVEELKPEHLRRGGR